MQGKREKAKEFWEEFVEVRDPRLIGASHQTNFEEFEKIVDRLQLAMQECAGCKQCTLK